MFVIPSRNRLRLHWRMALATWAQRLVETPPGACHLGSDREGWEEHGTRVNYALRFGWNMMKHDETRNSRNSRSILDAFWISNIKQWWRMSYFLIPNCESLNNSRLSPCIFFGNSSLVNCCRNSGVNSCPQMVDHLCHDRHVISIDYP